LEKALAAKESRVVEAAVYLAVLSESLDELPLPPVIQKLTENEIPGIDLALCAATELTCFENLLILLRRHEGDTLFAEAAVSGLAGKEEQFLTFLKETKNNLQPIRWMLKEAIAAKKQATRQKPQNFYSDELTKGLELYKEHCSGCHRHAGEGIPNVAPPLVNAGTVNDGKEKIVQVILYGLDKPVKVNGQFVRFNNAMPAFKDNDQLSQNDIEAIAAYVQNAFGRLQ
jgi:mono/diheme cytochrome c family protein